VDLEILCLTFWVIDGQYFPTMDLDDSYLADEAIRFTGLDKCAIGIDQRGYIVYSYAKMLEHFMKEMSREDAEEWISFNVVGIKPDTYTVLYNEY